MSPTEVTKAPSEQGSQGDLDLGLLAWVLEELRKSLDSAVKGVRRFVREAQEIRDSDLAALDTASLRTAKQQLHQSCGALDMVGMPQAALLLRAMESAVQYYVQKPQDCTDAVAQTLEKASFSLIEYLETILAGKHIPAVALFPQYRDVHSLFGSEGKVHPADLWPIERRLREPVIAREVTPLSYGPQVRKLLDACVLHIVKGVDVLPASARMREICLGFAQSQDDAAMRIFWKVGAAYFDAMAHGMLKADVYTKRVASRVLMLSAAITKGDPVAPDRLLQDMLFFCAQAAGKEGAERAQVLQAVYETFGLQRHLPVDYEQSRFGRFDPVLLAQARKRIASSTEIWSSLAGGDKSKIKPALDQFTLVCDSLTKLHPGSDRLSHALMQVMHSVAQEGQPPAPAVAMEVATAVLYLQAAFASLDMAEDAMDAHSATLAQRLEGVQAGQEPQPLETWMEQLYRQVSDQQTMGSVVGELRGTLAEAEKLLDQYFRNPSDLSALPSVAAHLSQMRGVLSVLGLDQASQAMVRMRQNVERLQSQQVPDDEQTVLFEKMGNSLGALGFLIDMLSYQRNMARKLYEFDEAEGELKLLMGRTRARASDGDAKASEQTLQARTQPIKPAPVVNALASAVAIATPSAPEADPVKRTVAQAVTDAVPLPVEPTEALKPLVMAATPAPAEPPVLSAPALAPALLVEHDDTDDELLGIFLEEAKEVVTNGRAALQLLADDPANLSEQTILRRAFHTLKGSSRMVGLNEFGQAGWAMEQMLNAWLAEQKAMPQPMRQLALQALDGFESWAAAIEAGTAQFWQSAPFRASADAMRTQMRWIPLDMDAVRGQVSSSDVAEPVTAADSVHLQAADALALEAPAPVAADVLLGTDAVPDAAALLETAAFHAAPNILGLPPEGDPAPLLDAVAALSPRTQPEFEVEPEVVNAPEAQSLAEVSLPHLGIELDFLESVPTSTERSHIEHLAPEETLEITAQEPVEASALTAETIDFDEFEALLNAAGDGISAPILPPADELPALPAVDELQPAQALQTIALTAEPALDVSAATYDTPAPEEETIQHIGDLSIPVPLYTVYLGEAESWSYRLLDALTGWQENLDEAQPDAAYAWAHSLAGSSATVGFKALSSLSRLLENALLHVQPQPHGVREQVSVFVQAAQEVRRMLHQFAAGCLSAANPQVLAQLQQILDAEIDVFLEMDVPLQPVASAEPGMQAETITQDQAMDAAIARAMAHDDSEDDDMDVFDVIDPDLFPIFEEEAQELLPTLGASMRDWASHPTRLEARSVLLRALHTLKGSARLAGAMRLGEMAHRLESALEALDVDTVTSEQIEPLFGRLDAIEACFHVLRAVGAQADSDVLRVEPAAVAIPETQTVDEMVQATSELPPAVPAVQAVPERAAPAKPAEKTKPAVMGGVRQSNQQTVRVRSQLLDRLINEAGEVMIARSRLDDRVGSMKASLGDLTNNLDRLRAQLRDIEVQAESQMQSRMQLSKEAGADFDPLEFDRFTRVQELTRMMAESVNDVATVQRNLLRDVAGAEDDLIAQGRQARELQRDLLRTRMVEFDSISERLYAVVRLTSKETGKQVKLGLSGGTIEMDRGVLERMVPAFEHLLRNCVDHGIESPEQRVAAGKTASGTISVHVQQEGNDVAVSFHDDGAGLNLERIRDKALAQGLIGADDVVDAARAAQLVFMPGFTTAQQLTGVSGRGIGMDVVRSEVQALGGRIETHTEPGQGSSFRLVLPLTTAVTQVVMLRAGDFSVGIPASLVEVVLRVSLSDLEAAYRSGELVDGSERIPFFWAGAVWNQSARSVEAGTGKTRPIIIFRSASQRIALHVDEVLGHQEVVVKNLGPQMSRLPGLTGMSVLASGAVVLIYNPVALTAVYGDKVRQLGEGLPALLDAQVAKQLQRDSAGAGAGEGGMAAASQVPLVMVVDDSITVRRVSQRLLQREGYRVVTASDGLQALEKLQDEVPCVVLSDIEMPRMDGFDLLRNIRAQAQFQKLPIIMITSRIAQKHRDHAMELGANHYLGKPYSDEELMGLVHHYAVGKALPHSPAMALTQTVG